MAWNMFAMNGFSCYSFIEKDGLLEFGWKVYEWRCVMRTVNIQLAVPEGMAPYLLHEEKETSFEVNAMILYPFIQNQTISHGRAAEILGVHKTDLIEYYDSIGIPYLNQSEEELLEDLATMDRVLGAIE